MFKQTLIIILLLLPIFVLSAGLDYNYPSVPGGTIQSITKDSKLGDVIKYFSAWAIIIGVIIVFLSLIYAGILFLSSTGQPDEQKQAKSQIINSFLGLLILLGSYLVMIIINPQLTVLRIEKTPVDYGIILLTENGKTMLIGTDPVTGDAIVDPTVEKVVKAHQAVYLSYAASDMENYKLWDSDKTFGGFKGELEGNATEPTEVNFENLPVRYIGFVKDNNNYYYEDIKVIAYADTNFEQGNAIGAEYTFEGKLADDGTGKLDNDAVKGNWHHLSILESGDNPGIEIIELDFGSTKSKVDSYQYTDVNGDTQTKNGIIEHPPLSFQRKDLSPGVYLYGDKIGSEVYVGSDKDFTRVDKFMNNTAKKIRIKNSSESGKETDYIVTLHEESKFTGQFKIFFKIKQRFGESVTNASGDYLEVTSFSDPNAPNPRQLITDPTWNNYGRVEAVSSVHIRNLAMTDDDLKGCKEVWLCTEAEYKGACLIYSRETNSHNYKYDSSAWKLYDSANIIPVYMPVDILSSRAAATRVKKDGTGTETKQFKFEDKIKSIKIVSEDETKGTCMVALFEHPITATTKFPGNSSQVFFKSIPDLSGYETNNCLPIVKFRIGFGYSCASAVAIYPVK